MKNSNMDELYTMLDAHRMLEEEQAKEQLSDENVHSVINSYKERAVKGFNKYGTDTSRTDIDLVGWLNHLQEELMDATIYIERLKKEYEYQ